MSEITEHSKQAVTEIIEAAKLKEGALFIIGCSSSEVQGNRIGTATSTDVAKEIYDGVMPVLKEKGIHVAAQCCEHLNRALVVERATMEKFGLEQVNAIPQPNHAGGAFATVCYQNFEDPVLVETVKGLGDAGIDIGGTMIGMHLKYVAVPLRISLRRIGEAPILCARVRPKYVGGARAIYDENLM